MRAPSGMSMRPTRGVLSKGKMVVFGGGGGLLCWDEGARVDFDMICSCDTRIVM